MTAEYKKNIAPPDSYYEEPYLPGLGDRDEFETIPLLPVEAHFIMVGRAGKPLAEVDRLALMRISEQDGEMRIDFLETRRIIMAELGIDEEWD